MLNPPFVTKVRVPTAHRHRSPVYRLDLSALQCADGTAVSVTSQVDWRQHGGRRSPWAIARKRACGLEGEI